MDIAPEPRLVRRDRGRKKIQKQRDQVCGTQIKIIPKKGIPHLVRNI